MKRAVAVSTVLIVAGLSFLFFFGDNVRRMFAMSADSLSGGDPAQYALNRKKMLNFGQSNESYAPLAAGNSHTAYAPNQWTSAKDDRLSTFAIDVDTASYTLARRTIRDGYLPVQEGVRIEEWVNAFAYQLDAPKDGLPFSVGVEGAPSPFSPGRTLLKVSLQGRQIRNADRKPAHLVFLVDTSGSMAGPDRLGLAQESLRILTKHLNPRDTVALVTYAGSVREVLPPTSAESQATILSAIDDLTASGGTAMGSGLELAFRHAARDVAPGHVARVIVLTDGDANVGNVGALSMLDGIASYVKKGVTLTTVGFGMGNYRDSTLEQLADKGNGQSLYIDSRDAAKKVFAEGLAGTLEVIAKDVKIQVDFDPSVVREYRLLGYENRDVKDSDFRNDDVDGGEIGAGHSVTALYEVQLNPDAAGPIGTVFVRGKQPDEKEAFEVRQAVAASAVRPSLAAASTELKFAAAVAVAADILRGNPAASDWNMARAIALADENTRGLEDCKELVALLEQAQRAKSAPVASNTSAY